MMQHPKKYLIVGPAWVGDMVMAQTFFKLLKKREPNCTIDVLAPAWSKALLARMPEVNASIESPFAHGELALKKRYQLAQQLRQQYYDHVILLTNSFKSALIPFWSKIPKRTSWRGEYRGLLLTDVRLFDPKKLPLMIQRFALLALPPKAPMPTQLPWPELVVKEETKQQALQKFNLDLSKPVLALCPGAEFGPAKRWPSEHYAAVAQQKLNEGWQVWLFGSAKDQVVTQEITRDLTGTVVDLAGKTNLAEAIDLLSCASAVVSNDSGLMHISAALKRPIVAVYGSSSPKFTPPLSDRVKIISLDLSCSPCFKRECPLQHLNCLKQLAPTMVLNAIDQLASSS